MLPNQPAAAAPGTSSSTAPNAPTKCWFLISGLIYWALVYVCVMVAVFFYVCAVDNILLAITSFLYLDAHIFLEIVAGVVVGGLWNLYACLGSDEDADFFDAA
jgi:hypothetical protein